MGRQPNVTTKNAKFTKTHEEESPRRHGDTEEGMNIDGQDEQDGRKTGSGRVVCEAKGDLGEKKRGWRGSIILAGKQEIER
jgi:hypothetical protein